ncbi:MAG: hypothetical protein FJ137_07165 [Deltaproteobacteria bacterium]|nr:hypothetical protein [Deltaproteobacteria bacterium]
MVRTALLAAVAVLVAILLVTTSACPSTTDAVREQATAVGTAPGARVEAARAQVKAAEQKAADNAATAAAVTE